MLEATPRNTPLPPRFAGHCRAAANFLVTHGALVICALFLLAGVLILDDYGVAWDENTQRNIAIVNLDYIRGDNAELLTYRDRVYGVVFELPLLLTERALGLRDSRDIHLLRHILTHIFFIIGGFFCYRLAYRLFDNRLIALFALLLYLLHPRLYAHSFFNSKDVPFFSMFIIALYMMERAFRRDTVVAFILCGIAVGLLTNIRVMGIILVPAVVAMRGVDFCLAAGWTDRRRILLTGGGFILAAGIAVYAVWPYLWGDPGGRIIETLLRFSHYPNEALQLFRGRWVTEQVPPEYIPVWFSLTTPPPALLLGLVGVMVLAYRGIARPRGIFGNSVRRFKFLLLACFTLPVVGVILLESNLYGGWRHLYFIYAPGCLLAALGLGWLLRALPAGYCRAGVVGLAGVGAGLTVLQMMQLHPYQHIYFNFLVDRETPEYLGDRYSLDYWGLSPYEGLRYLSAAYPEQTIKVDWRQGGDREILPAADRERIRITPPDDAEFYIGFERERVLDGGDLRTSPESALYTRRIYNSTILVVAPYADLRNQWEQEYQSAKTGELLGSSKFDLYRKGNVLTYVKEPCEYSDREGRFYLEVLPWAAADLPRKRRNEGYEDLGFSFYWHGQWFNGKCAMPAVLPDYPLAAFRTGQRKDGPRKAWEISIDLRVPEYRAEYAAVTAGAPLIRSGFNVYHQDNQLIYTKEPCAAQDASGRFALHLWTVQIADLPPDRRQYGFDNLDFSFGQHGVRFDDKCLIKVPLPDYPLTGVETGQSDDTGKIWTELVDLRADAYRIVYPELTAGEPALRAPFNLYRQGQSLIYARENCGEEDAAARFALHLWPARVADLPEAQRRYGFDNRDFSLEQFGARFDGKCLAVVPLPGYPIKEIRTGQFIPGEGLLWEGKLTMGR